MTTMYSILREESTLTVNKEVEMNFYATTPQMIKFRTIVTEAITDFEAVIEGTEFRRN